VRAQLRNWLRHRSLMVRFGVYLTFSVLVFGILAAIDVATGRGVDWSIAGLLVVFSLFDAWMLGHPQRPDDLPNAWLFRRFPRLYRYFDGFRSKPEA
jgi:hypothetical protein